MPDSGKAESIEMIPGFCYSLCMDLRTIDSLDSVETTDWNALSDGKNPFLSYEFLRGLERYDCLTQNGWRPNHLLACDGARLVGAIPLYIKTNSIGEFVFDWSWAEAYERAGGRYYPKLVCAVPFTPVAGPRLLVADNIDSDLVQQALVKGLIELAEDLDVSSIHCLFPPKREKEVLKQNGLLVRIGCQFHWRNQGYRDFADFLDSLTSKKRKRIRQERRTVADAGIEVVILDGDQTDEHVWEHFYTFYCSTFHRNWGEPRLTLEFFKALARTMPKQTLLILARHRNKIVAGAFAMRGVDSLYGRHWGCSRHYRNLHFELCYYQTIDYCIRNGLKHFDAGAQGEHKLSRGFHPTLTYSAHWIRDSNFRSAVRDFVTREEPMVLGYMESLREHSPYKVDRRDAVERHPSATTGHA